MMKKNLLFVISQLYSGGAERALVNLLRNLSPKEYEVDLLILNQENILIGNSLIPEIPEWVHLCDAFSKNIQNNIMQRIKFRMCYHQEERKNYFFSAYQFVRGKQYEWAFHVGEWFNPDFVAKYVCAKQKAMWFHTDLNCDKNFDEEKFFLYTEQFSRFIFVSKNSLENSCKKYPFIRDRSVVINNINDIMMIKQKSVEIVKDIQKSTKPIVVTVANIRPEKNHLKQVEVMKQLKLMGVDFQWWNIGATADRMLYNNLRERIKEYGLERDFLILGARENPYPYIECADLVACLSDYESWSMVISEAKVLKTPVVATKTSGALEQIEDRVTGYLTDFSVKEIVKTLYTALTDTTLYATVKQNIGRFDDSKQIVESFSLMVNDIVKIEDNKDSILYVVDDINYKGGAHFATKNQINMLLKAKRKIDIFSSVKPLIETRIEFPNVNFYSWIDMKYDMIFHQRLLNCLTDTNRTLEEKCYKFKMSFQARRAPNADIFHRFVYPTVKDFFSKYSTVCIMSEGSNFKEPVALSRAKKKIQWIHTDYCAWKEQTEYGRQQSKYDNEYWKKFNTIVVLSDLIKRKMIIENPELEEKLVVVPNIMSVEEIRDLAIQRKKNWPLVKFVTVCRFEHVKAIPRLLRILKRLYDDGYNFKWIFVGNGEELSLCEEYAKMNGLKNVVEFVGKQENPYIYMKQSDVFGLFSYYEGLPNTIYEALILGIPVCATNVGGISDQIIPGQSGWLTKNEEGSIYETLSYIMEHPEEVKKFKANLSKYEYNNQAIESLIQKVFS